MTFQLVVNFVQRYGSISKKINVFSWANTANNSNCSTVRMTMAKTQTAKPSIVSAIPLKKEIVLYR